MRMQVILKELRTHAPFTAFGAATGIAILVGMSVFDVPKSVSTSLFWVLHPAHVLLSALATTAMYRLHSHGGFLRLIVIGYLGAIGIATLSDCIIPYLGEALLQQEGREIHFGFIEKWWLANPLALAGIAIAYLWPTTKLPHAGHVLLSTWASLFHMTMAMDGPVTLVETLVIGVFLFAAVWLPCCTSDIVFSLLFSEEDRAGRGRTEKNADDPVDEQPTEGKRVI